ncbi:MAG: tetratricopeptide repeat protein, partial [Verrucomicrobiaceae bacterium]
MIKQAFHALVLLLAVRCMVVAQWPQQQMQQAVPGIEAAMKAGQIHEALRQLEALHQSVSQMTGPNSPAALEILVAIADVHTRLGNLAKAEPMLEHVMAMLARNGALGSPDDGFVRMRLARLRLAQGKTAQADRPIRDALQIMERNAVPPASQNYTNALDMLCSVYEAQGRYEDYVKTSANIVTLVMQRDPGGVDHANALNRHARGLMMQTKFVEAALELKQAMEMAGRLGVGLSVADSAAMMAKCLALTGDYVQGEQIIREVIGGLRRGTGTEQVVAELQGMLAFFCVGQGKIDEAETLAKAALADGALLPGAATRKAHCLSILANVAAARGQLDQTRLLVNEATATAAKAYGETHPKFASFLFDMAELLGAMNDTGLAMPLAERALNLWLKTLNPGNALIALSWQQISDLWLKLEDYDKALVLLDKAAPVLKNALGPEHAKTLSCDLMRAKAYLGRNAKGDARRAQEIARRLLEVMLPKSPVADIETLLRLSTAAALLAGDVEAALASSRRLWTSLSGRLPEGQADGDFGNRLYISALIRAGQPEEARRRFKAWSSALHQSLNQTGSQLHARQWSQAQRSDSMFAPAIALEDGPLLFETMQRFKGVLMDLMEHEHQLMMLASRTTETRTLAAEVQSLTAALRRSWM